MTAVGTIVAVATLWFGRSLPVPASAVVLDLATGGVLMACGVVATVCARRSRSGPLLFATGVSWFFADFAALPEPFGVVASSLTYLHRGFLVHLLLTFPTGRDPGRVGAAVIAAGYLLSLMPQAWSDPRTAACLALGVVAATTARYLRSPGRYRSSRAVAAWCSAVIAAAVVTAAVARSLATTATIAELTLLLYEVSLMAASAALLLDLVAGGFRRSEVSDLVVEIGADGGLQAGLAWALGTPDLRLHRGSGGDAGEAGHPSRSSAGSLERTSVHGLAGELVATVEHPRGLLAEPELRTAVGSVILLDDRNRQLRGAVAARAAEVRAVRRRLLEAEHDEDLRLDRRLREGANVRLDRIAEALAALEGRPVPVPTSLREAVEALTLTRSDLSSLALGLFPLTLVRQGLGPAIETAARAAAPLEVQLDLAVSGFELPDGTQLTVYYCVSEALTNVVKHARARRAHVTIGRSGDDVVVTVADDGVGGALPASGRGLTGLTDRVAAQGGTLEIDSPPQQGTTVRICLPVDDHGPP